MAPASGSKPLALTRRAVGWASRRLQRPELAASFYEGARRELHEELALRAVIGACLPEDGLYVDVGTNRGQVLGLAVEAAPRGRWIAFEPIPALAAEVRRTFPGVDCRELALAAAPGTAEYCHFRSLDGWSGLRRSPLISDEQGDPEFITVTVSTLDEELGELDPALLKIDVEGAELQVLEGASRMLQRARPVIVFEHVGAASAIYGVDAAAPHELLGGLGYEIRAVTGGPPVDRDRFGADTQVVNWLATPRGRPGARS